MGDRRRHEPVDADAKPTGRGGGNSPRRLAAIDSEGARVSPVPPGVRRRRQSRTLDAEPTAALIDASLTDGVGVAVADLKPRRTGSGAGMPKPREKAAPEPSLPPPPDIADSDAATLIKIVIEALGTALRSQYSADHRVYSDPELLADALGQGRRLVLERRSVLVERLERFAGVNVERVRQAWDNEVLTLGDIALQTNDWRVGSAYLLERWRQEVRVTDQGEAIAASFIKLRTVALIPKAAAEELEEEALPEAIAAILGLVDWSNERRLAGDLSNAQVEALNRHRDRVAELVAAIAEPHRTHYRDAFNTGVGIVATGEARSVKSLVAGGPRLKALLIREGGR